MFRIDSTGAAAALPTPAAVGTTVGYFTEGNPGTGTPATNISADWLNAVQEEITGAIEAAGITLDKTLRGQLAAALSRGGQCRLALSGGNLKLSPYNGRKIFIPGTGAVDIPSAGVTVGPAATLVEGGSPANLTLYYVYARMNAGALQLQLSATGHSQDATTGVEIRTGDATRALVGMCRLVGGAFVDGATQRFVGSWFNRRSRKLTSGVSGSTGSATMVEISSAARLELLTWGDEDIIGDAAGSVTNNTANSPCQAILTLDGASGGSGSTATSPGASQSEPISSIFEAATVAEGYHYLSLFGNTSVGTTGTFTSQICALLRI